jgi:hypothetical protein
LLPSTACRLSLLGDEDASESVPVSVTVAFSFTISAIATNELDTDKSDNIQVEWASYSAGGYAPEQSRELVVNDFPS